MRRRVGGWIAAWPVLALCASAAAQAQDAMATAGKPGPEVVPTVDIAIRADADERFAEDVIRRARARDPAAKLEPPLDALGRAVQQTARLFELDGLDLLPVMRLESLERHWRFYGRQLERWREELRQATGPLTADAAELARRRAIWEATRKSADAPSLAPAFGRRIDSVLARLELAEQAVSGPIDERSRLSRRANAVETGILAGQRAVAAAIDYNDRRLMHIDAPPIWELWRKHGAAEGPLRSIQTGLAIEIGFLEEYSAANSDRRRTNNAVALILLPMLIWLSVRSRRIVSEDPEIQASTRVLRRPVSSWLVLVLVGALVFEPDAPILLHQSVLLLALVPVLRLLPPAVYAVLGPWPYVATGLYLLGQLGFLFVGNPLHHRVFQLLLTLLTLGLLVWLLWRSRPQAGVVGGPLSNRIVRAVGWFGVATLAVSATASIVGNVSLAEMLTGALLDSGYVGLVLFAGVTVLASVLRLLLARRSLARLRIVKQHTMPLLESFTRLLRLAAIVGWVVVTLNQFRVFRPIKDAATALLTYQIRFGEISLTLGGVLLFVFAVWLAFWAAKTVRFVLEDEVLPKMPLPRGVGNSISSLTYYALVILGVFVALAAAGFEVSQFAIVIGALGVGIGFGLQNVVNNFVSGLILMFERPIQPGDVVEVSGTSGKVREIGMRATTLTTFEGADVIVPNGVLLNEKLINWTLSDMNRRLDVNVGVAYGSDPRRVLELLRETARTTPGVAAVPEPAVVFVGFGPSSLDFGIRAWTNDFGEWVAIRSELSLRVLDALRAAGITIPFPQQDVHLRSIAPDVGAALNRPRPPDPASAG